MPVTLAAGCKKSQENQYVGSYWKGLASRLKDARTPAQRSPHDPIRCLIFLQVLLVRKHNHRTQKECTEYQRPVDQLGQEIVLKLQEPDGQLQGKQNRVGGDQ